MQKPPPKVKKRGPLYAGSKPLGLRVTPEPLAKLEASIERQPEPKPTVQEAILTHTADGFPVLRSPVCFALKLIGPIMLGGFAVSSRRRQCVGARLPVRFARLRSGVGQVCNGQLLRSRL
jgi:hypothetical protein